MLFCSTVLEEEGLDQTVSSHESAIDLVDRSRRPLSHCRDRHNWELLSPIIPMMLLKAVILRRFRRKIADETFKNLSRPTTQWDEIVRSALSEAQQGAERRLEDLIATVEKLTSATGQEAPRIRADLERLQAIASTIETES